MKKVNLKVAVNSTLGMAENVRSRMSALNSSADEFKSNASTLGEKVKGFDTFVTEQMLLGLSEGLKGADIGKVFLAYEKDTIKHFTGTPRLATMKQAFANIKRVSANLDKVIGKTDKGAPIKGADKLKNAKGLPVPLQTVARAMPAIKKGVVAKAVLELSQAILDAASELAGEADWDRSVANKALAQVFADAKKKAA